MVSTLAIYTTILILFCPVCGYHAEITREEIGGSNYAESRYIEECEVCHVAVFCKVKKVTKKYDRMTDCNESSCKTESVEEVVYEAEEKP